jgi:electron transport complex protein RnfD
MNILTVKPSPHIRSELTTQKIMLAVIIALVPAIIAGTIVFGPRALFMVIFCALVSMMTEVVCRALMKKEGTVSDGSAMLTGVLLALNLPVTLPFWQAAVGCIFAIAVVKQLFGGLGCNFANPAITGRIFLLLSVGSDMTAWAKPFYYRELPLWGLFETSGSTAIDGLTGATPLATGDAGLLELFLGNVGGSIGETSALALLIGGIFLIITKLISPVTPVSYLGSLAVLTFIQVLITGGDMIEVPYALLSGGVILGAFFMATDYVTTPITAKGKLIFGIGCGILTFVIREFASMPEGCSFSILIMNLLTPYIDKFTQTKPIGAKKINAKEEA